MPTLVATRAGLTVSPTPETLGGVILVVALSAVAFRLKALNFAGSVSAVAIGLVIFFGGGWGWLLLLISFFLLASLLTKFRLDYKKTLGVVQEAGGARGLRNTLANGFVAATAAVSEGVLGGGVFASAFIGAMATSAADTLATEIGLLSLTKPRLITSLGKRVTPGTSGGITPLGTTVGVAAAVLISSIAASVGVFDISPPKILWVGGLGGLAGMAFDSLLGAALQARYRCRTCGETLEIRLHHGKRGEVVSGLGWMDNNVVNLLSTLAGALVSVAVFLLM